MGLRDIPETSRQYPAAPSFDLSKSELAPFFGTVAAALRIASLDDFRAWTRSDLQRFLPHEVLLCGSAHAGTFAVVVELASQVGQPPVSTQGEAADHLSVGGSILARWLDERRPLLYQGDENGQGVAAQRGARSERPSLSGIAAHSVVDSRGNAVSFFGFLQVPVRLEPRHSMFLELLVPHMHCALMRIMAHSSGGKSTRGDGKSRLTTRERNILYWLVQGKTNWEIALITNRSENTVKSHLRQIFAKLDVSSRVQAVNKAISLGLTAGPPLPRSASVLPRRQPVKK
ncbi:MAG: helix-turn-helix transcriptional regulator [Pseudomonadota bacterium]